MNWLAWAKKTIILVRKYLTRIALLPSATSSLHWLWTPRQWFSPCEDAFQQGALAYYRKRTTCNTGRLWFNKETISTFCSQLLKAVLTMAVKTGELTDAIKMQCVAGRYAVFQT